MKLFTWSHIATWLRIWTDNQSNEILNRVPPKCRQYLQPNPLRWAAVLDHCTTIHFHSHHVYGNVFTHVVNALHSHCCQAAALHAQLSSMLFHSVHTNTIAFSDRNINRIIIHLHPRMCVCAGISAYVSLNIIVQWNWHSRQQTTRARACTRETTTLPVECFAIVVNVHANACTQSFEARALTRNVRTLLCAVWHILCTFWVHRHCQREFNGIQMQENGILENVYVMLWVEIRHDTTLDYRGTDSIKHLMLHPAKFCVGLLKLKNYEIKTYCWTFSSTKSRWTHSLTLWKSAYSWQLPSGIATCRCTESLWWTNQILCLQRYVAEVVATLVAQVAIYLHSSDILAFHKFVWNGRKAAVLPKRTYYLICQRDNFICTLNLLVPWETGGVQRVMEEWRSGGKGFSQHNKQQSFLMNVDKTLRVRWMVCACIYFMREKRVNELACLMWVCDNKPFDCNYNQQIIT